jgi:hypothetical protein
MLADIRVTYILNHVSLLIPDPAQHQHQPLKLPCVKFS